MTCQYGQPVLSAKGASKLMSWFSSTFSGALVNTTVLALLLESFAEKKKVSVARFSEHCQILALFLLRNFAIFCSWWHYRIISSEESVWRIYISSEYANVLFKINVYLFFTENMFYKDTMEQNAQSNVPCKHGNFALCRNPLLGCTGRFYEYCNILLVDICLHFS